MYFSSFLCLLMDSAWIACNLSLVVWYPRRDRILLTPLMQEMDSMDFLCLLLILFYITVFKKEIPRKIQTTNHWAGTIKYSLTLKSCFVSWQFIWFWLYQASQYFTFTTKNILSWWPSLKKIYRNNFK